MAAATIKRLVDQGLAKPYLQSAPVPKGWALVCPYCGIYKMQTTQIAGPGYMCTGDRCGKIMSQLEAQSTKMQLYIVEDC